MDTKYELRVHSRDVISGTGLDKHTGYELVERDSNGVPTRIYTVDLWNDNGKVRFDIKDQLVDQNIYNEKGIIHGSTVNYAGNSNFAVTGDWLENMNYHTSPSMASGDSALSIFNRIKLEAAMLNKFSSNINYGLTNRNCNSSTQYFADKFLNGLNVFADLSGIYAGNNHDFMLDIITKPGGITDYALNASVQLAIELADSMSNVDLDGFNFDGMTLNNSNSQYAIIGDGVNSYKVYKGGTGRTIAGTAGDDRIIGGSGSDKISGNAGADYLYGGRGGDTLNGGAGADYLYGGVGNDILNGDDGNDHLYGGADVDTINGGNGDDYIVGGLGNDILKGGADNDTYVWSYGDGFDKITDNQGLNILEFKDVKKEDVKFDIAI